MAVVGHYDTVILAVVHSLQKARLLRNSVAAHWLICWIDALMLATSRQMSSTHLQTKSTSFCLDTNRRYKVEKLSAGSGIEA